MALGVLANMYMLTDRASEAEAFLSQAEKMDPDNPRMLKDYAKFYLMNGQWDIAGGLANVSSKFYPDNSEAYLIMALAKTQMGEYDDAIRYAEDGLNRIDVDKFVREADRKKVHDNFYFSLANIYGLKNDKKNEKKYKKKIDDYDLQNKISGNFNFGFKKKAALANSEQRPLEEYPELNFSVEDPYRFVIVFPKDFPKEKEKEWIELYEKEIIEAQYQMGYTVELTFGINNEGGNIVEVKHLDSTINELLNEYGSDIFSSMDGHISEGEKEIDVYEDNICMVVAGDEQVDEGLTGRGLFRGKDERTVGILLSGRNVNSEKDEVILINDSLFEISDGGISFVIAHEIIHGISTKKGIQTIGDTDTFLVDTNGTTQLDYLESIGIPKALLKHNGLSYQHGGEVNSFTMLSAQIDEIKKNQVDVSPVKFSDIPATNKSTNIIWTTHVDVPQEGYSWHSKNFETKGILSETKKYLDIVGTDLSQLSGVISVTNEDLDRWGGVGFAFAQRKLEFASKIEMGTFDEEDARENVNLLAIERSYELIKNARESGERVEFEENGVKRIYDPKLDIFISKYNGKMTVTSLRQLDSSISDNPPKDATKTTSAIDLDEVSKQIDFWVDTNILIEDRSFGKELGLIITPEDYWKKANNLQDPLRPDQEVDTLFELFFKSRGMPGRIEEVPGVGFVYHEDASSGNITADILPRNVTTEQIQKAREIIRDLNEQSLKERKKAIRSLENKNNKGVLNDFGREVLAQVREEEHWSTRDEEDEEALEFLNPNPEFGMGSANQSDGTGLVVQEEAGTYQMEMDEAYIDSLVKSELLTALQGEELKIGISLGQNTCLFANTSNETTQKLSKSKEDIKSKDQTQRKVALGGSFTKNQKVTYNSNTETDKNFVKLASAGSPCEGGTSADYFNTLVDENILTENDLQEIPTEQNRTLFDRMGTAIKNWWSDGVEKREQDIQERADRIQNEAKDRGTDMTDREANMKAISESLKEKAAARKHTSAKSRGCSCDRIFDCTTDSQEGRRIFCKTKKEKEP